MCDFLKWLIENEEEKIYIKYIFCIWTTSALKHTVTEPQQYHRPMTTSVVKSTAMVGQAMMAYTLNNEPDERTGQDVVALIWPEQEG